MCLNLKMTSKVHVFLLTWLLTQQLTGLIEPSDLDMAPNAFDDQYEGCVEDMERKAPQLLQEDFNMNEKLKRLWKEAEVKWNETKKTMKYPKGFNDYHGTAVVAYTNHSDTNFHTAVREFKKNPGNFHYKAFHYYLTRALQLLRNQNRSCYKVYRGNKNKFRYSGKGSVRFGHFGSSSFNKTVADGFGGATGTLFIIKTCLGVNISGFSYIPEQKEVLIPVYEVYDSVTVEASSKGNDEIVLDSPKRGKSNYNCFYSGSMDKSHFSSSATLLLLCYLVSWSSCCLLLSCTLSCLPFMDLSVEGRPRGKNLAGSLRSSTSASSSSVLFHQWSRRPPRTTSSSSTKATTIHATVTLEATSVSISATSEHSSRTATVHKSTSSSPHATRTISATITIRRWEGWREEALGLRGLTLVAFCSTGEVLVSTARIGTLPVSSLGSWRVINTDFLVSGVLTELRLLGCYFPGTGDRVKFLLRIRMDAL